MAVTNPSRDPRLVGYTAVTVMLAIGALVFGKPAVFMCAAPFAVAVIRGVRDRAPLDTQLRFDADEYSLLEGDEVRVTATFRRRPEHVAYVHVVLTTSWEAVDPEELQWVIPPGDAEVEVAFTVRPTAWGRLSLGSFVLELNTPGGLTVWEVHGELPSSFRVLPPPERVRELLPPPISHSLLGQHPSRVVGDGFDFAELRPYSHGDRLRDINWRASARFDSLQVNRRHPERNGDVILLLDTFTHVAGAHSAALQAVIGRAARAAWSIAQLHLMSQDRVGLATRGRYTRQLPTAGGDRARYTLLEAMLDIGGEVADGRVTDGYAQRLRIPPTALVVALTPLIDQRMTRDLLALRGAGRTVVVVVVDTMDLLPEPTSLAEQQSYRLFGAQLRLQRERLAADGMPVTVWGKDGSLAQVVGALRHLQRGRLVRR